MHAPSSTDPNTPLSTSGGSLAWGHIDSTISSATDNRVIAAEIRLFEGRHNGPNSGYGRAHIEAEHSKEYASSGLESFILQALSNFTEIYDQDGKRTILFRQGKSRMVAVLEYRPQEGYYSIVTVYRAAPTKQIKGVCLWKKQTPS